MCTGLALASLAQLRIVWNAYVPSIPPTNPIKIQTHQPLHHVSSYGSHNIPNLKTLAQILTSGITIDPNAQVTWSVIMHIFNMFKEVWYWYQINGLVQERRNTIANALELRFSCTVPSSRGPLYKQCLQAVGTCFSNWQVHLLTGITLASNFCSRCIYKEWVVLGEVINSTQQ